MDIAQRLSWRVPRLRFSGTPLVEAIPLFNRHSSLQLVIGDPEVGNLKLSGTLRADNTDSLVQLLQIEFAIKAEPRGKFEIVLRR
jgi:transmembrane sensor